MAVQQPHIIVIAGPNGPGKSTTATSLLKGTLGVTEFVNADVIAEWLSAFYPEGAAIHAERVRMGGHNVPEETIRRRYTKGIRNFPRLYKPLADTWRLYDNSNPSGPRGLIAKGTRKTSIKEFYYREGDRL